MKILVAIPTKPSLHPLLKAKAHELAARLPDANPEHELTIVHDYRKIAGLPTDKTAWARVTRARQEFIDSFKLLLFRWDYVLWIDADVVYYPADMPSRLIKANPRGIAAPMVFIEGNKTRLYDWAASIEFGTSHIEPSNPAQLPGRNLSHDAPYWHEEPQERIVPMDCVGTIVCVNSHILSGHRFEDHPSFTDWFTLCEKSRKCYRDKGVVIDRDCMALHADLGSGKYGEEKWH